MGYDPVPLLEDKDEYTFEEIRARRNNSKKFVAKPLSSEIEKSIPYQTNSKSENKSNQAQRDVSLKNDVATVSAVTRKSSQLSEIFEDDEQQNLSGSYRLIYYSFQ